jgi:hypothetical protein
MGVKSFLFLGIKLLVALLFGCVIAIGCLQNDPWLKKTLEDRILSTITSIIQEPCVAVVSEVDLIRGEVIIRNLSSHARDQSWSFECPEIRTSLSWLLWLLRGGPIDTVITFERPTLFTSYEQGGLAIRHPFNALMDAPLTLPITITQYCIFSAQATIQHKSSILVLHGASTTSLEPDMAITNMIVSDGYINHHENLLTQHMHGRLTIEAPRDGSPTLMSFKTSGIHGPAQREYTFYGKYADGQGIYHGRANDGSVSFEGTTRQHGNDTLGEIQVQGELGELSTWFVAHSALATAQGKTRFSGNIEVTSQGYRYEGAAELGDVNYQGTSLQSAHARIKGDEQHVKVTVSDAESAGIGLTGSFTGRFAEQEISGALTFIHPYKGIPHCTLKKGRSTFTYKKGQLTSDVKVESNCFGVAVPLRGFVTTDFENAKIVGTVAGNPFHLEFTWSPFTLIKSVLSDPLHQKHIDLNRDETGKAIIGTVDSLVLTKLIQAITGYQLNGSIDAHLRATQQEQVYTIDFNVKDASLKIPGTYTVIEELSGTCEIDLEKRRIQIHNLLGKMQKGSLWCSQGTFYLSSSGELVSAHIPLQCEDLLISKQKELFGTISGATTAVYTAGTWRLTGLLLIENAHLRSNLLSSQVQKDIMGATSLPKGSTEIDLAIRIQSRNPLKVKTSFLTTDAHVDVLLEGGASQPDIEGTIELVHGSFDFPYKPLFVTQGKLILAPHQPEGPQIELTAKSKLRAHTVTMKVTGTLKYPHVHFEASPELPEESILTLLLTGSEHGSLSAAMPRVIMEQIEDVLFGSEEKLSSAQQFLKNLLTPLKNVRIVKKDAAHDDLQAVVEVDLSDRLRAKAQKDLTLSDDAHLELEYTISDDVRVKAVRDQEGTLGGEVEMRWKF